MIRRNTIQKSLKQIAVATPPKDAHIQNAFMDRTCDVIVAFLNKNSVAPEKVPALLIAVHATLLKLFGPAAEMGTQGSKSSPNIRDSVTPDYIICLEDGKRLQSLKRYIGRRYGLTPDQYRQKWNLPSDYPMVAPNYAKRRSQIAKKMGLGKKPIKSRTKNR
jgi:predicted transcriptional regulator